MSHNEILKGYRLADEFKQAGSTRTGDYIRSLTAEALRLREALWEVSGICGADRDGDRTPAALVSDIVPFAIEAARDLRECYDLILLEK